MPSSNCDYSAIQEELFLSTDLMDPEAREALWQNALQVFYKDRSSRDLPLTEQPTTPKSHVIDTLLVGMSSFQEQYCERTTNIIAQGGFNHYVLHVMLGGTLRGNFNGNKVFAKPGDILIFDLSQIVSGFTEAGNRITIIIPRHELEKLVGWRDLHGTVLEAKNATTKLLFDYLSRLKDVTDKLSPTEQLAVKNAMLLLLASGINALTENHKRDPIGFPIRSRILGYIDDHITNPDMSPRMIQQRFRVSRSHLYRTFESDGGIAKLIRDKRLDHAYRFLIDRKDKPFSLKEIAYKCGFRTGTQFAKAFKSRFGTNPKELEALKIDAATTKNAALTLHGRLSTQPMRSENHRTHTIQPNRRIQDNKYQSKKNAR